MPKKKKINKDKQIDPKTEKQVRKAILAFLSEYPKRVYNHKQIAAGADLQGAVSHARLVGFMEELAEKGLVYHDGRGRFGMTAESSTLTGTLEVVRDGTGFVTPEDTDGTSDIYIHPRNLNKALHGDRVQVRLRKAGGGPKGRPEGEITAILERAQTAFVGIVQIVGRQAFFIPDDPRLAVEFNIVPGGLKGADTGDKVLLRMLNWDYRNPDGEVVEVLGQAGENNTEMHAILLQFGFQPRFPEAVETEAAALPKTISEAEIRKRRDFRSIPTFTIDPVDAKDFDDALSIQWLENGNIEIGVHIADVSHYVRPGTRLDEEALHRATSVYLVDRTVPMLPEVLSNDLCSLKPNVDRLSFSAVFEMTEAGRIVKEWFGKTVIHSIRRYAYEEAQQVLETGQGDYSRELLKLNELAHVLRDSRFKKGSINFEDDEVKFELDETGKPIRVFRKVRKDAHKMIEDWMLLANKKVAEYVTNLRKAPHLPFIYRIHDRPDPEKLLNLKNFASILGHELDLSNDEHIHLSLNRLMTSVEGKAEQGMIQSVAVRAMAKAVYSTENVGHYGLAFDHYTHFTSPIRRYPDLLVHRLLEQYLHGDQSGNPVKLNAMANHCSKMERKAVDAERASVKHKQVEYLQERLGQEFEGLVTGVTPWGFYVELLDSRCEGMVGLHDLRDEFFEVDERQYCLRGRDTGQVIRLGDKVLVEVKSVDLRRRQIDFHFVELIEGMVRTGLDALAPPRGHEMKRVLRSGGKSVLKGRGNSGGKGGGGKSSGGKGGGKSGGGKSSSGRGRSGGKRR